MTAYTFKDYVLIMQLQSVHILQKKFKKRKIKIDFKTFLIFYTMKY